MQVENHGRSFGIYWFLIRCEIFYGDLAKTRYQWKQIREVKNSSVSQLWPLQWRSWERASRPLEVLSHLTSLEIRTRDQLQPSKELHHHIRPYTSGSKWWERCGEANNGGVDNLALKKPCKSKERKLSYLTGGAEYCTSTPSIHLSWSCCPYSINHQCTSTNQMVATSTKLPKGQFWWCNLQRHWQSRHQCSNTW